MLTDERIIEIWDSLPPQSLRDAAIMFGRLILAESQPVAESREAQLQAVDDRAEFEQWYAENAFDYAAAPVGSRDSALSWRAWQAARALRSPKGTTK